MTTKPDDKPLPQDGQVDRTLDPEYAAISTMAVLGLVAGVLGLLSLEFMPLVVLPALGLVMGLLALRKIKRSEGVLTGRGIAVGAAVLGGLVLAGASGYHLQGWLSERRLLEDLSSRSYEITDDILAGRYDKVYNMIPEDLRRRQGATPAAFRAHLAPAFAGAGSILQRTLMSLKFIPAEDGSLLASATMRVELERRYLDVQIVFRQSPAGTWDLIGVGAGETFESQIKFAPEEPEPKEPATAPPPPAASKP